mgnify:CR=1 FL=1
MIEHSGKVKACNVEKGTLKATERDKYENIAGSV